MRRFSFIHDLYEFIYLFKFYKKLDTEVFFQCQLVGLVKQDRVSYWTDLLVLLRKVNINIFYK